jgi:hypothetical protein
MGMEAGKHVVAAVRVLAVVLALSLVHLCMACVHGPLRTVIAACAYLCILPTSANFCCAGVFAGVVERCKLLDVQYISKQYLPQAEDDDPFGEHNVPAEQRIALSIRVTLQRLANPQLRGSPQKSPEKQEEQQQRPGSCCSCYGDECAGCSSPSDKENKQRAAAADASAAANGTAAQCNDSSCSGCGEALVCVLEYPVLHLEGNDYIVPASVFDRGMADWSSLTAKDRFVMLWDGRPCL